PQAFAIRPPNESRSSPSRAPGSSNNRADSFSANRPGAGSSNIPLQTRWRSTRCSESASAPAADAKSAIPVTPAAMWSAMRNVATTWTHHGVQRSLRDQMSGAGCEGMAKPPWLDRRRKGSYHFDGAVQLRFARKFPCAGRSPRKPSHSHRTWHRKGRAMTCRLCNPCVVGLMLVVGLPFAPYVRAACCYFSAKDKDIQQPSQKVFITWDPASKVETFTVQPKFEGNARDFGMVIPTPSQPKLHEMPRDFFKELAVYTIMPTRQFPQSALMFQGMGGGFNLGGGFNIGGGFNLGGFG